MKSLLYILIYLVSLLSFAQNETLFKEANTKYNEGNYQEAITAYESILETGEHSAELYFNLANANYKLNRVAPSVYYYEKALQLDSNDQEIKSNLAFAQNMTIDSIEEVPEVGISKFFSNILGIFSYETWAKLAILFMLFFVGLFIAYYFAYLTRKKRLAFISSIISLFLMLISFVFAFQKYNMVQNDQPAIVFSQEAEVKSEPNLRSAEAFKLHEGTKVQILDTVNNWKKIKLADGKTGWIPSGDIKAL